MCETDVSSISDEGHLLCTVAPEGETAFAPSGLYSPDRLWATGQRLGVQFLDPIHPLIQMAVLGIARLWSRAANIDFDLAEAGGDIRITTRENGNWSHLGTDARLRDPDTPTMCLSVLRGRYAVSRYRRVILHEFGHALGLGHEHQHPRAAIRWDEDAAIRAYAKLGWPEDKVRRCLFSPLADHESTAYDERSVMHYPIPAQIQKAGKARGGATRLSRGDRELVARLYPGRERGRTRQK